ncbi:molecular chaperone [Halomonas sp. I5-271120]|uniref:TorD/DmsD family molecular chaperone n=1 Tax=Halomonas sp. I5-271120 TaxID=3061632 RepID=UPI002714657E|nr:molecular chaperone TorD family protein [Halomonas sp. I5-271120]
MTDTSATTQPDAQDGSHEGSHEGSQEDTDALRADIYRLLARLVREPPSAALLTWLSELDADADGSTLAKRWTALIQSASAQGMSQEALAKTLSTAHFRHLVGVVQGEITPYASWYRQGNLMDEALLSLRRDLRRLGISRAEECHDPEDHLAAVCETMAMLLDDGQQDEAAPFFMAHLAPWATRCFDDLAAVDTPFYAHLGALGSDFMSEEHRHQADEAARQPVRIVTPDANSAQPTPDMTDN